MKRDNPLMSVVMLLVISIAIIPLAVGVWIAILWFALTDVVFAVWHWKEWRQWSWAWR